MLRLLLLLILITFVARAFWRVVDGMIEGLRGTPPGANRPPAQAVAMVRDPVCGTFVLPDRSVTLSEGGRLLHFCSARCRDQFRARPELAQRT